MSEAPRRHYRPARAVRTEYRVGLCAWQDRSMLETGQFYPRKSMTAEDRLWWYSRFFDSVEVNSSFYAPLSAQNAVAWAKRTPPGFVFSVKAYALLTGHRLDAGRLPPPLAALLPGTARPDARGQLDNDRFPAEARDWAFAALREGLEPLRLAGKLGYVLFQMAPWVRYGPAALDYLATLPERLPGHTIAVEFRDASWLPGHADEALRFLAERGLTYVSVDVPRIASTVAPTVALTTPVAIVRLHGRNAAGWLKQLRGGAPGVAEKYGYLYREDELRGIVAGARALEGSASRVYLSMNNNAGDAPAINGGQIRELLDQEMPARDDVVAEWRARLAARRPPRGGRGPAC